MLTRNIVTTALALLFTLPCYCWGFYAHRQINYIAVFLLPPGLVGFYKKHIDFLSEHSTDADKRRHLVEGEAAFHFIDLDRYGMLPFDSLPHDWKKATEKYGADSLTAHGIVPWHTLRVLARLTQAFRQREWARVLKLSADLGHYMADAHVPLHTTSNYNGQQTGQKGIHALWESRLPELFAEQHYDFFIGKAAYIRYPEQYVWNRILQSAAAVDSVLAFEREATEKMGPDGKFGFEWRNGLIARRYSTPFCQAYHERLNGMVEHRMRASIEAVASMWYTAWVNAGQPEWNGMVDSSGVEHEEWEQLGKLHRSGLQERICE